MERRPLRGVMDARHAGGDGEGAVRSGCWIAPFRREAAAAAVDHLAVQALSARRRRARSSLAICAVAKGGRSVLCSSWATCAASRGSPKPSTSVIDILNRWFEILEKTVVGHGGEILKFMGDGFLAMFAIDQEREVESCCGAVAAVASALPHLDAFIAELRRTERITVGYGVTLHAGTVVYGNVGGRERLDFTVIGPAVNRVSRLQEVAKLLGEPVLASRDVAQLLPDRFASLGAHPLRDLDGAMEVFRLVRSTGPSEVAGPPFSFKDSGLS